jgi:hypothetical protein
LTDTTHLGSIDLLNLPKLVFSELNFYLFYYFISTLRDAMAYFKIKNTFLSLMIFNRFKLLLTTILLSQTSLAATFDTFLDDAAGYQAAAGSLSRLYFEDFSGITANSRISASTQWNGFSIDLYNGGSNVYGGAEYTVSLQESIYWNQNAPNIPGVYGDVGDGTGIMFTPSVNTIAGFSFSFIDWNDGGQRSIFQITASDGTSVVVEGPTNTFGTAPSQNFGVKLSAADIAANRYITGIKWYGLPNNYEVVGFWDFSLFTNTNLDVCVANDPNCVSISQLQNLLGLAPSGPSSHDTQYSLQSLEPKLRTLFSSQMMATNFANMNTYDCNLFDAKGLCVSVGGQQTYVDSPSANMTSAVVVAGYKVSPTLRIGGFLNQNVNSNTGSNVDISNNSPLMGLFAVWNQNENHLGYQVKFANAYQDMDVTTTRDVIGTSEAGRGKTDLNTQSYVGELSYAFLTNEDKTLVRPYAAMRYTRIKQDGYSERTTSAVTAPLTYASLSDRSTAALVGVKLNHKLTDKVNLTGSLGVEQDLNHDVDNLTASGVSGLTSEAFNNNINRTRPVASIGAYYMPVKNQRIAADIYYQELPFQSTASTTAYVNYMIGF